MTWELARHIVAGAALTIGAFGLVCALVIFYNLIFGERQS